jgi:hypothetical protein
VVDRGRERGDGRRESAASWWLNVDVLASFGDAAVLICHHGRGQYIDK